MSAAALVVASGTTGATPVAHQRNELRAQANLAQLLRTLPVPAGSRRSTTEPPGDRGRLTPSDTTAPNLVSAADLPTVRNGGWWIVPKTDPAMLVASIAEQLPLGDTPPSSLQPTIDSATTLITTLANGGPFESDRWLTLEALPLPDGTVGLRADAGAVWLLARPPSEHVPAAVSRIRVSERPFDSGPRSVVIRGRRMTRRLIADFDRLTVQQPGFDSCADYRAVVWMSFFLPRASTPVAVAAVNAGGGCDVRLTLGGHIQPDRLIISDPLVRDVQALGIDL